MDLSKLLDLIRTSSLYLRRADGFADRLEGALFPALRNLLDEAHHLDEAHGEADCFYRRSRVGNFVSCWSIGNKDNMALWHLYGGPKTSVAVTTTVERLIRVALSWGEDSLLYRVNYVDHLRIQNYVVSKYTDMLRYKNEAYRYERELRLIVPRQGAQWERNPLGIRLIVPVLGEFVRSIVVAPESESWFFDAVNDLCIRYKLSVPVRRSKLAAVPT